MKKKKLKLLKDELEIMYAIELLEYHNKNYLSGDNKSRSEERQEQLKRAIKLADEIKAL